jgi:hypothetical protein
MIQKPIVNRLGVLWAAVALPKGHNNWIQSHLLCWHRLKGIFLTQKLDQILMTTWIVPTADRVAQA